MLLGPLLYGEGHQNHIAGLRKAVLETMGPGGPAHTEFQDTYPRAMKRQEGAGPPSSPEKWRLSLWVASVPSYEPISLRFQLNRNSLKADPPQGLPILPNTFSLLRFSVFTFLSHTPRPLIIPWTCQPPHQREIGCPVEQEAWWLHPSFSPPNRDSPVWLPLVAFFFSLDESYMMNSGFLTTNPTTRTVPERLRFPTAEGSQHLVSFKNVSVVRWKVGRN